MGILEKIESKLNENESLNEKEEEYLGGVTVQDKSGLGFFKLYFKHNGKSLIVDVNADVGGKRKGERLLTVPFSRSMAISMVNDFKSKKDIGVKK